MSALEWTFVLIGAATIVIIWQLGRIGTRLVDIAVTLRSLDAEVFRFAQEENPSYGLRDNCGRRAIVRHVVPKGSEKSPSDQEMFYCQACWWMSDSVTVSDENKRYKDRLSDRDRLAAEVGPA